MLSPRAAPSEGRLSGMRESEPGSAPLLELSLPVSAAASGSAVLDEQGRLLGIATFNFRGQRLGLALPAEWLHELPARGREALAKHKQALAARPPVDAKGPAVALVRADAGQSKERPREGDTWTYAVIDVAYKPNDRSRKFVHTIRSVKRGTLVEEEQDGKG